MALIRRTLTSQVEERRLNRGKCLTRFTEEKKTMKICYRSVGLIIKLQIHSFSEISVCT